MSLFVSHNTQCTSLVSLTVFKIINENRFFRNYNFVIPASCGVHKRALKVNINVRQQLSEHSRFVMLWMCDQIAFLAVESLRCELLLDNASGTAFF